MTEPEYEQRLRTELPIAIIYAAIRHPERIEEMMRGVGEIYKNARVAAEERIASDDSR